jgi:predicted nucleic acid-binding protein
VAAVLVDTTVLIDALRGRPVQRRLRRLRELGDLPCICAVNVEEVLRGIRLDEIETVERFLQGFPIVPLTYSEGRTAGDWRREHARRGTTLSQADCLIAAAALRVGGRLATGNPSHFPMTELTVEHWPAGR